MAHSGMSGLRPVALPMMARPNAWKVRASTTVSPMPSRSKERCARASSSLAASLLKASMTILSGSTKPRSMA
ncbi:hypothetical protein G6F64_015469 [Rhizopus arrhizus]|uniref:Uncharacterized protein n=1 Tax=Rhizopus oryzae TaxID=64495 RepID=A0A9P7BGW8_RHIOR|nr:hypothetical protein G6F24_018571 [Rhizopus arrhizus]KAG1272755.1 hypothetical protein G6F64_015469 [Rhizopus arrhizus]